MFVAIVPAYNEEKNIGSVVRSLFDHVDKVIVVDDASLDQTPTLAKEAGAIVISHQINRGQGAAIETGHEYARNLGAGYVLHFDGDNQFAVSDIKPALEKLKSSQADILFGSRFLGGNSSMPWFKKYFIHPLARLFHKIFHGLDHTDAHNGFRILNKKALDSIIITQNRMAHASEIPILAKKHNLEVVEFPVQVSYSEYGQKGRGAFEIIKDLWFGKYVS